MPIPTSEELRRRIVERAFADLCCPHCNSRYIRVRRRAFCEFIVAGGKIMTDAHVAELDVDSDYIFGCIDCDRTWAGTQGYESDLIVDALLIPFRALLPEE